MPDLPIQISRSELWDSVLFIVEIRQSTILVGIYFDDPQFDIVPSAVGRFLVANRLRLANAGWPQPIKFFSIENYRGPDPVQLLKIKRIKVIGHNKFQRGWTLWPSHGLKRAALDIQSEGAFPVSKRLREAGQ
jgi:hypothetical protein